ncbi:MAG: hypothetical protein A2Y56_15940 [Candidatus Aminicenantes bacterium RBG_13_63_10]|nr:MAG: hypothetical protein A2Y56_15940 [Candidatus Aminicenantes bacterium RBG_13_63_10]
MKSTAMALSLLLFLSGQSAGAQEAAAPRVLIETSLGDIIVEVYPDKAPLTAANFLSYVDKKLYSGASFYRAVRLDNQPDSEFRIEVLQGGMIMNPKAKRLEAIEHETTETTGLLHQDGVLSMARSQAGTAASEFFVCLGDQPELDFRGKRNPDLQGFAAFGKVVQGMDVVRAIHGQPVDGQMLLKPVVFRSVKRLEN